MADDPRLNVTARWGLGLAVSAALIGAVIWWADPAEIGRVLWSAKLGPLAAALALYAGVLTARWVRLVGLVDGQKLSDHRLELLWASAGHSFATQLMPARSGELTFPALWKRATGESLGEGTVFLGAIRVVELGVLIPLYGVGLIVWLSGSGSAVGGGWIVAGLAGLGLLLLVGLPHLLRAGLGVAGWLLLQTRLADIEALEPLREAVPDARAAIERLGRGRRLWLVGTTLAMWLMMFGVFTCVLLACGADLGLAQSVVGAGGGIVGNLLPIGGIGSLGTMEAGWTAAFEATGAPRGPVVAAGLLVHLIVIAGTGSATAIAAGLSKLLDD
jgi:uncharacterized membrane protein YbhN (UPF0104 family)